MLEPMTVAAGFVIVCALVRLRIRRSLAARGYLKSQIDMSTWNRSVVTGGLLIYAFLTWLAHSHADAIGQQLGVTASLIKRFGPAVGFSIFGVGNLLEAVRLRRLANSIAPPLPPPRDD